MLLGETIQKIADKRLKALQLSELSVYDKPVKRQYGGHNDILHKLLLLPDGGVISCGKDGCIKIWDLQSGKEKGSVSDDTFDGQCVYDMAAIPGCDTIVTGDAGEIKSWDLKNRTLVHTFSIASANAVTTPDVTSLVVLPAISKLVAGRRDGTLCVWNLDVGNDSQVLSEHTDEVSALLSLHNGRFLASGAGRKDPTIKIRNLKDNNDKCNITLIGHDSKIWSLVELQEDCLASASADRTVRIWDVTTKACKMCLEGHKDEVRSLVYLRDHGVLASGSLDKTVRLWNVATGACIQVLEFEDEVRYLSVSADGSLFVSSIGPDMPHGTCNVKLWQVSLVKPTIAAYKEFILQPLVEHNYPLISMDLSNIQLDDEMIILLSKYITTSRTLSSVNLVNTKLTDVQAQRLLFAYMQNKNLLARFSFAQNEISEEIASQFTMLSWFRAAENGNTEMLISLQANVDSTDHDDNTALHLAMAGGHKDTVQYLVEVCKSNVNLKNKAGLVFFDLANPDLLLFIDQECPRAKNALSKWQSDKLAAKKCEQIIQQSLQEKIAELERKLIESNNATFEARKEKTSLLSELAATKQYLQRVQQDLALSKQREQAILRQQEHSLLSFPAAFASLFTSGFFLCTFFGVMFFARAKTEDSEDSAEDLMIRMLLLLGAISTGVFGAYSFAHRFGIYASRGYKQITTATSKVTDVGKAYTGQLVDSFSKGIENASEGIKTHGAVLVKATMESGAVLMNPKLRTLVEKHGFSAEIAPKLEALLQRGAINSNVSVASALKTLIERESFITDVAVAPKLEAFAKDGAVRFFDKLQSLGITGIEKDAIAPMLKSFVERGAVDIASHLQEIAGMKEGAIAPALKTWAEKGAFSIAKQLQKVTGMDAGAIQLAPQLKSLVEKEAVNIAGQLKEIAGMKEGAIAPALKTFVEKEAVSIAKELQKVTGMEAHAFEIAPALQSFLQREGIKIDSAVTGMQSGAVSVAPLLKSLVERGAFLPELQKVIGMEAHAVDVASQLKTFVESEAVSLAKDLKSITGIENGAIQTKIAEKLTSFIESGAVQAHVADNLKTLIEKEGVIGVQPGGINANAHGEAKMPFAECRVM